MISLPLFKLIGQTSIAALKTSRICPLAPNVRAVLLVALLEGAAQLLCGLQVLTQLLYLWLGFGQVLLKALRDRE